MEALRRELISQRLSFTLGEHSRRHGSDVFTTTGTRRRQEAGGRRQEAGGRTQDTKTFHCRNHVFLFTQVSALHAKSSPISFQVYIFIGVSYTCLAPLTSSWDVCILLGFFLAVIFPPDSSWIYQEHLTRTWSYAAICAIMCPLPLPQKLWKFLVLPVPPRCQDGDHWGRVVFIVSRSTFGPFREHHHGTLSNTLSSCTKVVPIQLS